MIKIKDLRKEEKAVFWTVEEDGKETAYRTNETGEGLFLDCDFWYSHQKDGTAQFQLKQKTAEGIRKALYRYFSE